MSKSLRLVNGDLAIGDGRSFDVVTGRNKLVQDLGLWFLERIGQDRSTPTYGSRLDGGVIDGKAVPSLIGTPATPEALAFVRAESLNILGKYRQLQDYNLRADTLRYGGRNTFDPGEIIQSVDEVNVRLIGTTIVVRILITTAANTQLKITLPLPTVA
jgi:hypothetical protein